jgi:hypothetical protein
MGYLTQITQSIPSYATFMDAYNGTIIYPYVKDVVTSIHIHSSRFVATYYHGFSTASPDTPINYASFALGARPIEELTSDTNTPSFYKRIRNAVLFRSEIPNSPSLVLRQLPSELTGGLCWPLKGSSGHIAVSLFEPIHISNVTVSHSLRPEVDANRSAPRDLVVWGIVGASSLSHEDKSFINFARLEPQGSVRNTVNSLLKHGEYMLPIARMTYKIEGGSGQTQWVVPENPYLWRRIKVRKVLLQVETNWGNSKQTCLYNFEVFGET